MIKAFENLFTGVLFVLVSVGILLVLSQFVGVIILNGGLMIWARNTLQSFAVIMAGIASFMSLIYSYFLKRDDRVDNEE